MTKPYSEKPESLSEEEIRVIEGRLERPLTDEEKDFYNDDSALSLLGLTRQEITYLRSLETRKFLSEADPIIPLEILKKPNLDLGLLTVIAKGIYRNDAMRYLFSDKKLVFDSNSPTWVKIPDGPNIEREDLERLAKSHFSALAIGFGMEPLKAIRLEDWQLKNLYDVQSLWRERQRGEYICTPDEIADLTEHQVKLLTTVVEGHTGEGLIAIRCLRLQDLHILTQDDLNRIHSFPCDTPDSIIERIGFVEEMLSQKTIVSETGRNQPHIVHIGDILSVMNDHLVDGETTSAPPRPPGGIMQMLDEMIGRHSVTTDIGRAYTTCAPFLQKQFPQLTGIVCTDMSQEGREKWLAEQVDRFGEYFYVQPISEMELRHDWDSLEEAQNLAGDTLIQICDIDGREY
jgi:hypothetical protein